MGEFTENLLKLTEFPFSYSFIGLLALISGQGTNLENLTFEEIGPLLILMGFVGTTLSICDPLGGLQRRIILGRDRWISSNEMNSMKLLGMNIFGKKLLRQLIVPYIFAVRCLPEDIGHRFKVYQDEWEFELLRLKNDRLFAMAKIEVDLGEIHTERGEIYGTYYFFKGLQRKTVKTKWIKAEIDRITSLLYFIIVILAFIAAVLLLPNLLEKFSQVFQDTELVRLGIIIFSIAALAAVSYMFVLRIKDLLHKARIVFNYLTVLEAVKVDVESYKTKFQDIQRYLDESDWTLADYWVKRIQIEYIEYIMQIIWPKGKIS
jgi:hypothetical protein